MKNKWIKIRRELLTKEIKFKPINQLQTSQTITKHSENSSEN